MTRRLLAVLLGVTTVVLIALTVPLAVTFERQRETELATSLERDALRLGDLAEDRLEGTEDRDLQALVEAYQREAGGRVVIVDRDGIALADSDPPADVADGTGRSFATRPEIITALDGDTSTLERRSETLDDTLFVVAAPVRSGDRIIGAVRVSRSTADTDREVAGYRLALAAIAGVALATAAVLGWVTARWATRPVHELQRAAGAIEQGDLGARADIDRGPAEVRDLADRFNSMADQLGRLIETTQQFAADASHQLRTPLTAIKLRLDLLVHDRGEIDHDDVVDALAADIERLERTIDGILSLTRIDQSTVEPRDLDLAEMSAQRCRTWQPAADEEGVELVCPAAERDRPLGRFDPNHLEQVLDNLIANALEFAPPHTAIELTAARTGRSVELHVTDHGPGIAADRRALAVERHWHGRAGGTGLGLAICARLCEHNGASLRLDETPGGGLDAVITMPGARADPA